MSTKARARARDPLSQVISLALTTCLHLAACSTADSEPSTPEAGRQHEPGAEAGAPYGDVDATAQEGRDGGDMYDRDAGTPDGSSLADAAISSPDADVHNDPELEIPVRFVGLARREVQTAPMVEELPCPIELLDGEVVLTECVIQVRLDELNADFEELTGIAPFVLDSYEVVPYSLWSTMPVSPETKAPLGGVDPYMAPGRITVVMPDAVTPDVLSGVAALDQRVNEVSGGWVVMLAHTMLNSNVLEHEFGHLFGTPHLNEAAGEVLEQCGGITIPERPTACVCEFGHLGGATLQGEGCPPCDFTWHYDTPYYGPVMREIANCWLEQNILQQNRLVECDFQVVDGQIGLCAGPADAIECECPMSDGSEGAKFVVSSCEADAADERGTRAREACGGVATCDVSGEIDVHCEGLASDTLIPCSCSNGAEFYSPPAYCVDPANAQAVQDGCGDPPQRCTDAFNAGHNSDLLCFAFTEPDFTCVCPNTAIFTTFTTPSCDPGEAEARLAAAVAACGITSCEIPDRPDVICHDELGTESAVTCTCPNDMEFQLPPGCTGADFADGIAHACGEL